MKIDVMYRYTLWTSYLDSLVVLLLGFLVLCFIRSPLVTLTEILGWAALLRTSLRLAYPLVYPLRWGRWLGVPGLGFGLFWFCLAFLVICFYAYDPVGFRILLYHRIQDQLDRLNPWLARPRIYAFFLFVHLQAQKISLCFAVGFAFTRLPLFLDSWFPFLLVETKQHLLLANHWLSAALFAFIFLGTLASWIFSPFMLMLGNFQESWGFFYKNLWVLHPDYARRPTPLFLPGRKGFAVEERTVRRLWLVHVIQAFLYGRAGLPIPDREFKILIPRFSREGFLYYRELAADFRRATRPKGFLREFREVGYNPFRVFFRSIQAKDFLDFPPR